MVNAVFFYKMNPNYFRLYIIKPTKQDLLNNILFGGNDNSINKIDKIINNGKELIKLEEYKLIIYYLIIPGFNFDNKLQYNNFLLLLDQKDEANFIYNRIYYS